MRVRQHARPAPASADRDRLVDFIRVVAIVVVIAWHWSLSIVHRGPDGVLVMPNPLADLPSAWPATWLLQVVPLFFIAGGYVNLGAWRSARERGAGTTRFYRRRFRRLLLPTAVFAAVWLIVEVVGYAVVADYRGALIWADIVVRPLWFIAAYAWVIALVPVTARLHERRPAATVCGLGAAVALIDFGRFGLGLTALAWVNTALVWLFIHQLGYQLRDGGIRSLGTRRRLALAGAALAVLAALTAMDAYPVSLVAHRATGISHMYPTTAVVAAAAVFQLAVVILAQPALDQWLRRPRVWAVVAALNTVVLTLFLWHMTALILAVELYEGLGFALSAHPTALWWAARPVWVLVPALILAVLVAVFAPVERRARNEETSVRTS
jgi:peptidoglycan/LPS O-acetylase OafA/YrhL